MSAAGGYLSAWKEVKGHYWSGGSDHSFLPKMLTSEERQVAMDEIRAMSERFYSTFNLPVITPDNCREWLAKVKEHLPSQVSLWTWFSGSSTLATCMMSGPFFQPVPFPVDLRYGWNIADPVHQNSSWKLIMLYGL